MSKMTIILNTETIMNILNSISLKINPTRLRYKKMNKSLKCIYIEKA